MLEEDIEKKSVEEIIDGLKKRGFSIYNNCYIIKITSGEERIAGTVGEEGVWLTRIGSEEYPELRDYLDKQEISYHKYPGDDIGDF